MKYILPLLAITFLIIGCGTRPLRLNDERVVGKKNVKLRVKFVNPAHSEYSSGIPVYLAVIENLGEDAVFISTDDVLFYRKDGSVYGSYHTQYEPSNLPSRSYSIGPGQEKNINLSFADLWKEAGVIKAKIKVNKLEIEFVP